ncbi:MAG: hypothetical protein NZ703_04680 [Gemmataceae bacterium]|nr:hypothetical protein [Gemmataceae bacterium]
MMRSFFTLTLSVLLPACLSAQPPDTAQPPKSPQQGNKPMLGLTLEIVAKKNVYVFDGGGKTPQEYKKHLESLAERLKKGEAVDPPSPLQVDLVLRLTNTSEQPIVVHVGGDPNVYTFTLSGGSGVVVMNNPVAFTTEFRMPKAITLAPGKSHDIPVTTLADGHRGFSRLLFWTGPGEYTLTAEYVLTDAEGRPGITLKSSPTKITVRQK